MLPICGRIQSVSSFRILIISRCSALCNSRMRLLDSTTSVGSINTVFPVADSSCIMPRNLRFKDGATGMTSLPSRMVGVTSLSISPSRCAVEIMVRRECEIPLLALSISERMRASSGEALSLILPYLFRMASARFTISGKRTTPSTKRNKAG